MVRLALILAAMLLPAVIVGFLLLLLFPHIGAELLIGINLLLIIGGVLLYFNKAKRKAQEEGTEYTGFSGWKLGVGVVVLGICTVLGSRLIFEYNKAGLYIDNASEKDITVKVAHLGSYTIKAGKHTKVQIVKGDVDVEYNNIKKHFIANTDGKWVWNIDSLNSYVKTEIVYSTRKDADAGNTSDGGKDKTEIITKEFFNPGADYVFEVPDQISIKKKRFEADKDVVKVVLYKISDLAEQMSKYGSDDIESNSNDSTGIYDDEVVQDDTTQPAPKPGKKK